MTMNELLMATEDDRREALSGLSYRKVVELAKTAGVKLFTKDAIIRTLLSAVSATPAAAEENHPEPTLDERAAKALEITNMSLPGAFYGISMEKITADILAPLEEGALSAEFYDLCGYSSDSTPDSPTCISFIRRHLVAHGVDADAALEELARAGEALREAIAAREAVRWLCAVPGREDEENTKIRATEEAYTQALRAYKSVLISFSADEIAKAKAKADAKKANEVDHLDELATAISNVSGTFEHKNWREPITFSFRASAWRKYGKARCYVDANVDGNMKKFGYVEGGKFYANDIFAAPIQKHLEAQICGLLKK